VRRVAARFLAAGAIVFAGITVNASPAPAADSVTASVTEIRAVDGKVAGTLTLRSRTAVRVDPASMNATIDGVPATVTITQGRSPDRRTMLVIDTSGSMDDVGMATVRAATASFLKAVPGDVRVGVVSFANTAGVDLEPTTNRTAVQRVVNGLDSRGNTALYDGVQSAIRALGKVGDRSMVLLSDGADTVADDQIRSQRTVTKALKDEGIRVDVVRFRSTDPDAARALSTFAGANGGSVTSADDTKAVVAAFDASAKALEAQVRFEVTVSGPLTGSHDVRLSGRASGVAFTVTSKVDLDAPVVTSAPPLDIVPSVPGSVAAISPLAVPTRSWFPFVAAGLLGVGLFVMVAGAFVPTFQSKRQLRVGSIEQYVVGPRTLSRSENKSVRTPLSEQLTALGERAMTGRRFTSWVARNIETADLPFRLGDWFILSLASIAVGSALGFVIIQDPVAGLGLGLVVGTVLPQLVLRFLAERRAKKFERVLPDVLMLVSTSLRSGFGLPQALDGVARDAAEPAAKEFSRALAETRIGTDIADALDHAALRMGSKSLRWTTMAIRIQREVGGNLAETLVTTASTLRERESLFRQVRALSAEGRLSAYILVAIPIFLFLYLTVVNYEYISLLWTRPMGLLMLGASIISIIIGLIWMRRIVQVEV